MRKAQPDPMRGVFRWAFRRVGSHLNQFALGSVGLAALIVLLSNAFALPPKATFRDRLMNGFLALLVATVTIVIIASIYAVVIGPYEQRNALRNRVRDLLQVGDIPADHLNELHQYAHAEREVVTANSWNPRLTGALADAFRAHFPEVMKSIDEWNTRKEAKSDKLGQIMYRAYIRAADARLRADNGEPGGFSQLILNLAQGPAEGYPEESELIWEVRPDGRLWTNTGRDAISTMKGDRADDPFAWIDHLQQIVRETSGWSEVQQLAQHQQRLAALRKPLAYDLELIELNHELGRTPSCRVCGLGAVSTTS